jgi:hypothetical protein
MAGLSLQDPFAAGHEQPQPASNQKSEHQNQAPHRKEKQGQDSGVLRLGLQQPFDDANGRKQADRASGQAGEENDVASEGSSARISIIARRMIECEFGTRQIKNGGRTRDRTLDLSRVKGTLSR